MKVVKPLRNIVLLLSIAATAYAGWSFTAFPLDLSHPVVLGLAALILVMAFFFPYIGTLVLLGLMWLGWSPPVGILSPSRVVGVLVLVGIVARRVVGLDRHPLYIGRFDYLYWGFILVATLGALISNPTDYALDVLFSLLMSYLLYWLMVNMFDSWQRFRIAAWVIVACTLPIAISITSAALTSSLVETTDRFAGIRETGFTGQLGYVTFIIVLWLSENVQGLGKLLFYAPLPLFGAAMFLSGSRAALVALAASALVLLLLLSGKHVRETWSIALVVVLVVGVAYIVTSVAPLAVQRTLNIPFLSSSPPETVHGVERRLFLSRLSLRLFGAHPFIGVGYGNYTRYVSSTYIPGFVARDHNLFTSILAETGVLGWGFFVLMYFEAFLTLWRARAACPEGKEGRAAIYALTLLLGYNIVIAMVHGTGFDRTMFVVFALGSVVGRLSRDHDEVTGTGQPQPSSSVLPKDARANGVS